MDQWFPNFLVPRPPYALKNFQRLQKALAYADIPINITEFEFQTEKFKNNKNPLHVM